jgi:hypothetical protein
MSILQVQEQGYSIIQQVYSEAEVRGIIEKIERADPTGADFRKTSDLFAIRRFLHVVAGIGPLLFTPSLRNVIDSFGPGYFPVKSIYFDKPGGSNWFVAYHQDLTISVNKRVECEGYSGWTVKGDQFAVKPPVDVLENIFTIRIHLDDADENNGALRVVPRSHLQGVARPEPTDFSMERYCNVPSGGIMVMKPLLLHASGRSVASGNRRVIHIEFSNRHLPHELDWGER